MLTGPPRAALAALVLLGTPSGAAAQRPRPESPPPALSPALAALTPQLLEAPLRFLADDAMEGRAPGTRGGDLAARYIASELAGLGLRPGAPNGTYYQWVSLAGLTSEVSLVIGAQRHTLVLEPGTEFVAWPERADSLTALDAEIVFVGHGISAPEWDWDDYKGAPQTGRIVMVLPNEPTPNDTAAFRGEALTSYGLWSYKLDQAARMGAVGVLLVHSPETVPFSWEATRAAWSGEHLLADRPPQHSLRFAAWITADAARRIVEATGKDYALLLQRAAARGFRPVDVGARAAVDVRSTLRRFRSPNVIARLEGADSTGRADAVLVSANYDHLGMLHGEAPDSVYNGAVDNASGVSLLLAAATALSRMPAAPRRSVVFLSTTAAEAGGLGAAAYVTQPPVPLDRTVADVNLDGANVWGPTRDIVALGAELSTLDELAAAAARAESLRVTPDPYPQFGDLYRLDQIAFARTGVPIVLLRPGIEYAGKQVTRETAPWTSYLAQWYHRPSDQLGPDWDYGGMLQQARWLTRLVWLLAQGTDFPVWRPHAEFRPAGQRLHPPR